MLFRQKSSKWDKLLASFIVLVNADAWLIGMRFFHVLVKFSHCIFFYCTFTETFAVLFQKWNDHEWRRVGHPLFDCVSFRRRHICVDWNQQEVLLFTSFLSISNVFSMFNLNCTQLCSLKVLVLFSHRFSDIVWLALSMQYNFTSFVFASFCLFFLLGSDRIVFQLLLKPIIPFSSFLSLLIFFCCSTPSTAVVVSWMIFIDPYWASVGWWPCWCWNCNSGLVILEKTWTSVMQLSPGPGESRTMLFRHKWRKLDTVHTFFIVLFNILAL